MRELLLGLCVAGLVGTAAHAADGLITLASTHSVVSTMDRLEGAVREKGLTVFARIDHSAGAHGAGLELPPTQLLVFGNPRVGTPLMGCARTVGIDLPQKALVWEDDAGKVWLAYNDPAYLAERHQLAGCEAVLEKVNVVLGSLAAAAAPPTR
jgi:uncharacterized protein (DUF302 family)